MEVKKIFGLALILLSVSPLAAQPDFDKKLKSLYSHSIPTISPKELQAKQLSNPSLIILDTRSEEEYKVSHLPKASFIDYDDFDAKEVATMNKNTPIVVYCTVGYRSERIGEKLVKLGFKNVYNLYGGIVQWKNDGLTVVNSKGVATDSVHTYNKNWGVWLLKGKKVY